jgi:hypothetical protein
MRFRIRHFAYALSPSRSRGASPLTRRAGAQGRAGPAHAEREMRPSHAEGNANWSDPARDHACLASVLAVHAPRGRAGRSWTGTWRSTSPSCAYTGEICALRGTPSDHAHLCAVIMRICAYAHMLTASCAYTGGICPPHMSMRMRVYLSLTRTQAKVLWRSSSPSW